MGLSGTDASAQFGGEMTPKGYWNPAPTTAPVINLCGLKRLMPFSKVLLGPWKEL
jgi:hypothetical protein